eukprot:gene8571-6012_t
MPPKKKTVHDDPNAGKKAPKSTVISESLRITDAEKHATSKSMYGDSNARISSNVFSIHDRVRHRAYEALYRSMKGKRVLHLGCGMGLYSMLAAKAHAAQVVAVDHSSVVDAARVVAEQNGLANITFLRGHLREVLKQLPTPERKFDLILCEWMGTFLLNERVLADVLYARDHLMAPSGSVCPSSSALHVCGVSDYYFRLETEDYWSNVYGFKMEPMKTLVRQEVEVCSIPCKNIVTNTCRMHSVDMRSLAGLSEADGELSTYLAAADKAEEERQAKADNPILAAWTPLSVAVKGFEADFEIVATEASTIHYLTFFVDATYTSTTDPGANFVIGINPGGGGNAWTEASVGLLEPLPVATGEIVRGTVRAYTPLEQGGKVTVVEVKARTSGMIAKIETTGRYCYQAY